MKRIGFLAPRRPGEKRLALIPRDMGTLRRADMLFFETGYGGPLNISDAEYAAAGGNVCARTEAYECDIICSPKCPPREDCNFFQPGQVLFGWIHAVQGLEIAQALCDKDMTGIAWEDMVDDGLYCFWRNRELAGEAAILHACQYLTRAPDQCAAAIIGRGNCARGAFRALARLGSRVRVYDRKTVHRLRAELPQYDVVANAVMWDVFRTDHLIYREDLPNMRPGSLIVDISCDEGMGVETSRPTTIADPVYEVDGVIHYAVSNVPSLFHKSATEAISPVVQRYLDDLIEERANDVLEQATVIRSGRIIDDRIARFQNLSSGLD